MKQKRPNSEPENSQDCRSRSQELGEPFWAAGSQRRPCGLPGALLLSLPSAQAAAMVERVGPAQETSPVPIADRVARIRERLGAMGELDPRIKAAQDEALRLSRWPDWSDWYNR